MEIQLLQAVGKIAGIGGLALGVFVLLFEEVIRKNIFPMLSDDHASGLIRQFMYLTFGVAVCGIVAWTFVALRTPSASAAPVRPPQSGAIGLAGTWKAPQTTSTPVRARSGQRRRRMRAASPPADSIRAAPGPP